MLKKNIDKQKRKSRLQTFVGVRPVRFKKKTAYSRQEWKKEEEQRSSSSSFREE